MTVRTAIIKQKGYEERQSRASKVSIAGALFIMLIAGGAGFAVDSITMIIDAATSLIMVATGILMVFTLGRIHRPPDELFNFGYHKYEPFSVVGQGFLIIATCVLGMKFAIQDIIHPEDIKNYYVPAITTAIAGAVALTIYFYMRKEAKETGSNLLKMASVHWITDAILEFGLFAGFLLGFVLTEMGRTKYTHYIDPIMTMILAGYLIKGPMAELIRSSGELLDASPEAEIKQKVKQMVDKYSPKALGEHRIRTRKAGGKIFVDVRFDVDPGMTAEYMAHLAHNFEREMSKHLPDCDVVVFFKSGSGNLAEGVA